MRPFHLFTPERPDIGEMGRKGDIPGLIQALQHRNYDIQWKAAEALGSIGEPAFPHVLRNLGHTSRDIRLGAVEALGDIRDFRATEPLIDVMTTDESSDVRWAAALALGEIGDPRALPALLKALREPDRYLRHGAAISLGKLYWHPKTHRDRAYLHIARQEWDQVAEIGEPAVEPLTKMLKDPDIDVRMQVLEVLGKIGGGDAEKACTARLEDRNPMVRWNAVLSGLRCGVRPMTLPNVIAKRPRVRKNPLIAAAFNFLLPGFGYTYIGRWWGFMFWNCFVLFTLFMVLFEGQISQYIIYQPVPVFVFSPFWIVFAAHAYYLATKLPEM